MKKTKSLIVSIATMAATAGVVTPLVVACKGETKTVEEITIAHGPDQQEFYVGQTFTTEGLVLHVKYSDKTEKDIRSGWKTNYDGKTFTDEDIGDMKEVKVTYAKKFVTYPINVKKNVVWLIETEGPTKKNYKVGECLDLTGMVVTAYLSSGDTRELTSDEYETDPDTSTPLTADMTSVTVKYVDPTTNKDITCTFNINVTDFVTSIETEGPTKTEYTVGEYLDLAGMVVTARLASGDTKELTSDEYTTNPDTSTPLTPDMTSVTVTYKEPTTNADITCTFDITVNDPVVSIETEGPTKTEYTAGEYLDLSGMVVTARLASGDTKELTSDEYETDPSTTTPLTPDMTSVTVIYIDPTTNEPITCTFDITVS